MSIRLTIKNYRCFVTPAVVVFNPGFTAFVGVNNAGKSALIRFFVEFRHLFQTIQDHNQLRPSLIGYASPFQVQHVLDPEEVFSNLNENPIEISIDFLYEKPAHPDITQVRITIARTLQWHIEAFFCGERIGFDGGTDLPPNIPQSCKGLCERTSLHS